MQLALLSALGLAAAHPVEEVVGRWTVAPERVPSKGQEVDLFGLDVGGDDSACCMSLCWLTGVPDGPLIGWGVLHLSTGFMSMQPT